MAAIADVPDLDHRVLIQFALDTAAKRNDVRSLEIGCKSIARRRVKHTGHQGINVRPRNCRSSGQGPEERSARESEGIGSVARVQRQIPRTTKIRSHDARREVQTLTVESHRPATAKHRLTWTPSHAP